MASPNLSVRLYPEPLRSLVYSSISGTFTGIGTGLANPCRLLHITNNTDALLFFSFDGVTDHFVVPSFGFILLDVASNHTSVGGSFTISAGQRVYVAGDPSDGFVYVSAFYGSNT